MSEKEKPPVVSETSSTRDDGRRKLVKSAALGVGGISLAHWSRPVVESVVLPVHAQTTGPSSGEITGLGSGSGTLLFGA